MLAEIVLPAGKDRVFIREIPDLFADAIHPAIPSNTPRQVTALRKLPLNKENSRQWCGKDSQPFPVSMTANDVAKLSRGVWKDVPPLQLPIDESDWQQYRVAFDKKPPKDWALCEYFENRVLGQRVLWHDCPDLIVSYTQIGVNHLDKKSDENKTKSI